MNKGQKLNLIRNFNMNRSQRERLIKILGESNNGGGENDKDFLSVMREFEGKVANGKYDDKFIILDDTHFIGTNLDLMNFLHNHQSYTISEEDVNNQLLNFKPLTYANGNVVTVDDWKKIGANYTYSFNSDIIIKPEAGCTYNFINSYKSEEDVGGFIDTINTKISNNYQRNYALFSYNNVVYSGKYFEGSLMSASSNNLSVHRVSTPNWIVYHTGAYFPNKAIFHSAYINFFNLYYNEYIFCFNLMIEATEDTTITKKVYDEKTGAAFNVTFNIVVVKDTHNFTSYNLSLTSVTPA